jgi:hypothetical protein
MVNENENSNLRKVITKVMTVEKGVNKVFDFFEDIKNMEIGGAIKLVTKGDDGWWTFEHIVAGKSKMKQISVREFGILDHRFIGGGFEWHVYTRIIPNQKGSTTTWTFIRPDGLTEEQFEEQLKGFDNEIDRCKMALQN